MKRLLILENHDLQSILCYVNKLLSKGWSTESIGKCEKLQFNMEEHKEKWNTVFKRVGVHIQADVYIEQFILKIKKFVIFPVRSIATYLSHFSYWNFYGWKGF